MIQDEEQAQEECRAKCRRQMKRPLELRVKYGFYRVCNPEADDAPWRSFDSTEDYRVWYEAHLPDYLGCKRAA